jgi:hypothetical protein
MNHMVSPDGRAVQSGSTAKRRHFIELLNYFNVMTKIAWLLMSSLPRSPVMWQI